LTGVVSEVVETLSVFAPVVDGLVMPLSVMLTSVFAATVSPLKSAQVITRPLAPPQLPTVLLRPTSTTVLPL
jgi:hypothetical protein